MSGPDYTEAIVWAAFSAVLWVTAIGVVVCVCKGAKEDEEYARSREDLEVLADVLHLSALEEFGAEADNIYPLRGGEVRPSRPRLRCRGL